MHQALLYKKLPDNFVQCTACSWYCRIAPGKTGICGVRQNRAGNLYLTVYGKPVAVHVDPVEKKPLFHFLPGTKILSLGTIGCNFACQFCQNWDISQAAKCRDTLQCVSTNLPPDEIIKICLQENIPSIAFTYNEPSIFFEYAFDVMKLAKQKGIKTVYVSNGYESKEQIAMLKDNLDAINIDLKAFSEKFYLQVCHAKLRQVLDNIERFHDADILTEITTLLIPGENDSGEELAKIAGFLADIDKNIPWHVTKFHPDYIMLDKTETPDDSLNNAFEIGKKAGLKYVYVGNVFNEDKESTYCPKCREKVIGRNWDKIGFINFKDGKCMNCNATIQGIWK